MPLEFTTPPKTKSVQWYRLEETEDVHNAVFSAVEAVDQSHQGRCLSNIRYLSLYENLDSLLPGAPIVANHFAGKITFNVIRSCIDTAASKIAASKPRPEFNSDDGDYRDARQAQALTDFTDALFYVNGTYQLLQDAFRDSGVFGTGVIQVYRQGNSIKHERVRIEEILVDDYEGQYGKPQNFYHRRPVFRDHIAVRAETEGWDKAAIAAIKNAPTAEFPGETTVADMIYIVEAWHLPTKNKDGELVNGKHAVCIQNHTLAYEEYKYPKSPFVFYRWSPRVIGFYGTGLAEELVPIQYEIAQVLRSISRNNRHTGLKVFIEPGSGINPQHLSNPNAPVIEAMGIPTPLTFPGVSQETYAYLENLVSKAYQISGISQATASASRSPGITSNVALQTISDQQTERFLLNSQRFEQFACQIAELSILFAKDIYQDAESRKNLPIAKRLLRSIRWGDLDLESSSLKIKCFPVSAFTQTPAARLQQIQDWQQAGALPPHRAMQLMGDNPDYREEVSLQTASLSRTQLYLDRMKHEGEYNPPDMVLDLQEALELAKAEINRSIVQDVPEHNIQLMRQFADEVASMLQPPAPAAPPPLAPMAVPEAPPTSPMLPVAPQ